ncbi:TPA: type IV secretion protein Rhs, partial [Escherichia coli]|nr:type IV secretion protein Rhs [Escherichia coli]EFB1150013.1 type IV secretion protein Rhs [Escherichia coli]EFD6432743.1 type IV secretion protein Rhs [Escherichia coli]EFN8976824.1 type IV secretion protein Rhs [Escherichia coli]EFN9006690.1 type IV secretion protein Rhs [Escherichia coli]
RRSGRKRPVNSTPLPYFPLTPPALFQPQRSPTHCPVPNTAPTGASVFRRCG